MILNRISKIYADALYDISVDVEIVCVDLKLVKNIFDSNPELFNILCSPVVAVNQKTEVLDDVFKSNIDIKILNFLKLLVEKNHIKDFEIIYEAFLSKYDSAKGIKKVKIISAIELNDEYKNKIINAVKLKICMDISPIWEKDEDIIGGLVIKYDDIIIDSSIKTKLNKMIKGNL